MLITGIAMALIIIGGFLTQVSELFTTAIVLICIGAPLFALSVGSLITVIRGKDKMYHDRTGFEN